MERLPPYAEEDEDLHRQKRGYLSCWESMGLARLWRKLVTGRRRRGKLYVKRGSFGYDPLSYAQNFDEGHMKEEEEEELEEGDPDHYTLNLGFSSRFAALNAPNSQVVRNTNL